MTRRFFRGAALIALTEVAIRLKGLVFIPLLTRRFGAVDYGVWTQVLILVQTMTPLAILGTDNSVMRFLPGMEEEKQKRVFSAWLLWVTGAVFVLWLPAYWFRRNAAKAFFGSSDAFGSFILLGGLTLLVTVTVHSTRAWFRIRGDASSYSKSTLAQAVAELIALMVMLVGRKGVIELVTYTIIADACVLLWMLVRITRTASWSRPDFSAIPALVKYGLPIVPAAYAMWGLNSLDRLFLVHYTNLAAIGIYAFAYSSGYLVIQMLVNPIYIMYPSAAAELHNRGERTAAQQLFEDCIRLMCALTIPAIAGIAILAGPLVKLVATDAFSAAAPLIGFITAGYLLSMLASYCEITLGLINRQYWSTIAIMIAVVVNVFLNLWLIPIYTIKGAAVATMVSFAAQFAISVSVARYYNVARFPFARLVPILAASAVMAVAVQIVHRRLVATTALFDLAVSIFTGVVVYAALVVPLRIVDRAIVHDVALWLRRGRAGATP